MPTWLSGYGPSNLEALLALVLIGALVVMGYWLLRGRARREAARLESALAEARRQAEELQGKLAEVERQRGLDEVRHQADLEQLRRSADPGRLPAACGAQVHRDAGLLGDHRKGDPGAS